MNDEDMIIIQDKVKEFISQNAKNHEKTDTLQSYLINLTDETYGDAIQFIHSNIDIFFKDHESTIFIFFLIIQYARFNYKNMELVLDVCINFKEEIKNAKTTENELIGICSILPNSIYYLYSKDFFSIESIVKQSTFNLYIFIYFLPEIEQYDIEYARKREKYLFPKKDDPKIKNELLLYEFFKSNPDKHILNRKINYHPSNLHKSIREDDIFNFQSIVAMNNYDVNHRIEFSFYERVMIHDDSMSLIQAAAIYGAEKIFKFLWMKNDIKLDYNLLKYAFCGKNLNIIHLCETKCSVERAYTEPIATQNFEILDYYIENFKDQIEETNIDVKEKLQSFHEINDGDNFYSALNYDALLMAVHTFNYTIIKECLPKIIFIAKKSELIENNELMKNISFMSNCQYNFQLFKFIYDQKNVDDDPTKCNCICYSLIDSLYNCANDSFKFLFQILKKSLINVDFLLKASLMVNHEIANYLLDLQIEEKNTNDDDENSIYYKMMHLYSIDGIVDCLKYYNEDIIVKMVKLADMDFSSFNVTFFVNSLNKVLSEKMIRSLFKQLSSFLQKSEIENMEKFYNSIKNSSSNNSV